MTTTPSDDGDEFWNIEDLAAQLHRSPNGIRQMRALNQLPSATRIGNQLYWRKAEIKAWLEEPGDDTSELHRRTTAAILG